jgi:large subunit ribosomal protein L16
MLLRPKKTKYAKYQRGRLSRVVPSFRLLKKGQFAIIAQESVLISACQIESTRQVINRHLRRKGKIWINIFPDLPLTSKPTEVRMGKGKGGIKEWVCRIKKGMILFEVDGVVEKRILQAFTAARKKLPLKTFVYKSPWKIKKKK